MFDMATLQGMRIPLTTEHILAGVRGAVKHHPIALAVNDVTDDCVLAEVCLMRESLVFCSLVGNATLAELFTTSDLEAWAWAYERGEIVEPSILTIFREDEQLWIGLQPRVTLARIVNGITRKGEGIILLCDRHLSQTQAMYSDGRASEKTLSVMTQTLSGECQMCSDADSTPIIYHLVPDSIEVHVVFVGGVAEVWEGAGGMGRLDYLTDNDGNVYTTMQALKKRGVRCICIENRHEIEVDSWHRPTQSEASKSAISR